MFDLIYDWKFNLSAGKIQAYVALKGEPSLRTQDNFVTSMISYAGWPISGNFTLCCHPLFTASFQFY